MSNVQQQNPDGSWSEAKPLEPDPRIWTHYYEARNAAGSMVCEGLAPWWYRIGTRVLFSWRWRRV